MKWYKKIIIITMIFLGVINIVSAEDFVQNSIKESIGQNFEMDSYLSTMNGYIESSGIDNIDLSEVARSLISTDGLDYKGIITKIIVAFSKEFVSTIKSATSIFIIIVIMSILSSLDIEDKGDITSMARLACFIAIATITVLNFIEIMKMFKNVVSTLTTIMQVVSPFLMSLLIATGAVTTTGIIQPLLLFISSFIGFLVNYIVFPFFTISVAFNIVSRISENMRFDKLSNMFTKSAIWLIGVLLTLFLGVLSVEGSISTSVDSLAVKTTQSAVSNFIPVVGKFFSDSFETVVGATKIIGKVGGSIGIIATIIVAMVPILKILSVTIIYQLLVALIEPICIDNQISKYLQGFATLYKNLLGILIGIVILFVIATGISLNLISAVVK